MKRLTILLAIVLFSIIAMAADKADPEIQKIVFEMTIERLNELADQLTKNYNSQINLLKVQMSQAQDELKKLNEVKAKAPEAKTEVKRGNVK